MDIIFQIIINSAFIGSIYFLVAIGFTLIYGLLRVIHFAHVDVGIVGVFLYIFLIAKNVSILNSLIISLIASSLLGLIIFIFFYKPFLRKQIPLLVPLIVSVGISIILQHVLLLYFGDKAYSLFFYKEIDGIRNFFGANYKSIHIIGIVAAILILLTTYLLNFNKLGRSIRAIKEDKELATALGIQPNIVISLVFIIFSPVVFMAIFFTGIDTGIFVKAGTLLTIKGFTISVIGGIGSIPGAFVAAMTLSVIERIVGVYFSASLKDVVVFVILIVFLLINPKGIIKKQ